MSTGSRESYSPGKTASVLSRIREGSWTRDVPAVQLVAESTTRSELDALTKGGFFLLTNDPYRLKAS